MNYKTNFGRKRPVQPKGQHDEWVMPQEPVPADKPGDGVPREPEEGDDQSADAPTYSSQHS